MSIGRSLISFGGWCVVLAALLIGSASLPHGAHAAETPGHSAVATNYLPDVTLIDQTGHRVSFAALKGKPILVGFIHTSCKGVCETLTTKMKSVAAQLEPSFGSKVTMVSVTTDPAEDTAAELAIYAKGQGTVGKGWLFLTGTRKQVAQILRLYGVPYGDPDDELTHVLQLFLIGPDGRQLHRYNSTEIAAAAVAADIRSADARR